MRYAVNYSHYYKNSNLHLVLISIENHYRLCKSYII